MPERIHRHRPSVTDRDLNPYVDQASKWRANLADYLQPGAAKAGALNDATLAWTVPELLGCVDSTCVLSQNAAAVGGIAYDSRTVLFPQTARPGDTMSSVTGGRTPWTSGTGTWSFTSGVAAAQNPRCAEADRSATPLAGVNGDYREIGPSTTLFNGVRRNSRNSIFFWSLWTPRQAQDPGAGRVRAPFLVRAKNGRPATSGLRRDRPPSGRVPVRKS